MSRAVKILASGPGRSRRDKDQRGISYQFLRLTPLHYAIHGDFRYSAASLALLLFLGFPSAFFNTGARNFPV